MIYRGYSLLRVRYGRSVPDDNDEHLYLIYAPDGGLVGDRWTAKGAREFVDSLLGEDDADGDSGSGVDADL